MENKIEEEAVIEKEREKETEKRIMGKIEEMRREREVGTDLAPPDAERNGGEERPVGQGGRRSERGEEEQGEENRRSKRRFVFLTDSNGREATENSIKSHMPRETRGAYLIENKVAYTLDEAFHRVGRGEVEVAGAVVVIDNTTNDIRGTHKKPAATPEELVFRVGRLRERLSIRGEGGGRLRGKANADGGRHPPQQTP